MFGGGGVIGFEDVADERVPVAIYTFVPTTHEKRHSDEAWVSRAPTL